MANMDEILGASEAPRPSNTKLRCFSSAREARAIGVRATWPSLIGQSGARVPVSGRRRHGRSVVCRLPSTTAVRSLGEPR